MGWILSTQNLYIEALTPNDYIWKYGLKGG